MSKQLGTIAVDLTPILPGGENGGAKIFVLELLHRLAEIAPQTQFILLTQAVSHDELQSLDRFNMRRLKTTPKESGNESLLRDMGVDLLFCPFTAPTYFEPGIRTVCTIYDLQYKTYPEFFAADDVVQRKRNFDNACGLATMFAVISDYSRDCAITEGGLDACRIRTIYLRMAQRMTPRVGSNSEALAGYGLTPHRYLMYPANFWLHKNHEMLLTAFGMACHQGLAADIKLVCTGAPGVRQKWLMRAARAMNLADRVLFPGYLPNAELAALMVNCTGVVFPSLYEGFGLPVIEAMSAGVPVACSNTTSLPEVVADAAVLFDPRLPTQIVQAMKSLVDDETLRASLIQAGQQRAAEFSDSKQMAREYWALFQEASTMAAPERQQILTLQNRLKKAGAEVTQLCEQNADAMRQIHTLTAWVNKAHAESAQLREQNADALRQIRTLTAWVNEARAESAHLREQNADALRLIRALIASLARPLLMFALKAPIVGPWLASKVFAKNRR